MHSFYIRDTKEVIAELIRSHQSGVTLSWFIQNNKSNIKHALNANTDLRWSKRKQIH